MTEKKKSGVVLTTGIVTAALAVLGLVLFLFSYTTNYYIYGQMNSVKITALIVCALVCLIASVVLVKKFPEKLWPKYITFAVTALLAAAALYIVGDRVEGIGNCIVTDYDSGHGGEEAIYMSLAGAVMLLAAMIYNIIGSFSKDGNAPAGKGKNLAYILSGAAVGLAAIIATLALIGVDLTSGTKVGPGGVGSEAAESKVYTVSYNQNNGNAVDIPDYQFLCSPLGGMVNADARLYIDETLTLDGAGNYTLFVDSYVIEGGARAVVGDDTGLGLVLTTKAEGTYTDHGDSTVTIARPTHAVFEMQTDTYSSQMKGAAQMNVNGNDADGVYDSNDEPAVLDFVPETTFRLADGAIVTYGKAALRGTFTVSYNQNNGNAVDIPDYQFLCSPLGGMVNADARMYIDETLTLDGAGNYTLFVDSYVIEGGARTVVGDDSGLGLVLTTKAEGTFVDNGDGTVTTSVPTHAVFEMQTDTYSSQMKGAAQMNVNGNDADGVYDSNDEPAVLDFVPETVWTLSGGQIVTYRLANEETEKQPAEEPATEEAAEPAGGVTVASDDGATEITFNPDGTYRFWFGAYSVEDLGTYIYENGILTLVNANGAEAKAEGDPLKLHYVTAVSDQLAGDYTIDASALSFESTPAETPAGEAVVALSDDGATEITFYPDGTYRFWFGAYSVEDFGTYTYENGVLTLTNANGAEAKAEGDPLKLHYVTAVSDQLTGDYTIPSSAFESAVAVEPEATEIPSSAETVTALSDDGATEITFNPDGTYRFWFGAYSVEDFGTYTFENGVLTLTNANGAEAKAEGDPLKLHYVTAVSDMLAGDYTIPASSFNSAPEAETAQIAEPVTVLSDDGATEITFNPDGTYRFWFGAYSVEDLGTYTFENGVLTLTNANGAEATAEGDPLKLHYVTAVSDMLSGDYTIDASVFDFSSSASPAVFTAISDDGATEITFNPDGTYRFWFGAYSVEDFGTYTFENGVLTLTNANGAEAKAEGDPLKLHYVTAVSDMLTGDYTIPASALTF